jgi:hypothetical protein
MPQLTAGRADLSKPHARCQAAGRIRLSGPAAPTSAFLGSESWRGTGAAGQARRRRRRKTTIRRRSQAPSLAGPKPPLRSAKPPGVLKHSRFPHASAGPGRRQPAHSYSLSGQTLLAHGTGRVIGGLHVQPAALRGASDVNSRTGDRRPRPRALCCTKMQLPIYPLLRLLGRRSAVPATPAAAYRSLVRAQHGQPRWRPGRRTYRRLRARSPRPSPSLTVIPSSLCSAVCRSSPSSPHDWHGGRRRAECGRWRERTPPWTPDPARPGTPCRRQFRRWLHIYGRQWKD